MKKYFVSFVFLVAFGGYAALQYLNTASSASYAAANSPTQQTQTQTSAQQLTLASTNAGGGENAIDGGSDDASESPQPVQAQNPTPAPAQTPIAKPKGQYVDGTYTGSVANAYYGNVQVQAIVSGGKLANVTFLQYPSDRSTSRFINQQAMPVLISEAVQSQSASVNGVSGASDTSAAFQESLASALSQAKS